MNSFVIRNPAMKNRAIIPRIAIIFPAMMMAEIAPLKAGSRNSPIRTHMATGMVHPRDVLSKVMVSRALGHWCDWDGAGLSVTTPQTDKTKKDHG